MGLEIYADIFDRICLVLCFKLGSQSRDIKKKGQIQNSVEKGGTVLLFVSGFKPD